MDLLRGGVNRDFFYPVLRVNSLLESFDLIEGLSTEDQTRMEAEGKFIRAFCFWGAVKMFAQPYGYTTDNSHPRHPPCPSPSAREPSPEPPWPRCTPKLNGTFNDAIDNLPEDNGKYATKDAAGAVGIQSIS